ncbi:MAG: RtcB family protein, partial [Nitrosomonas sp.]
TRAFAPGHPRLPARYRDIGQPVIIGGSMGTGSYILAGTGTNQAFASCSHGAAEEAPGAYKDVDQVAEVTEQAGLARRIAFLRAKVCIKG